MALHRLWTTPRKADNIDRRSRDLAKVMPKRKSRRSDRDCVAGEGRSSIAAGGVRAAPRRAACAAVAAAFCAALACGTPAAAQQAAPVPQSAALATLRNSADSPTIFVSRLKAEPVGLPGEAHVGGLTRPQGNVPRLPFRRRDHFPDAGTRDVDRKCPHGNRLLRRHTTGSARLVLRRAHTGFLRHLVLLSHPVQEQDQLVSGA